MRKPKYILTAPDVPNPLKPGGKGGSALVYSDKDLQRRLKAAKTAGAKVKVRRFPG